MANSLYDGLALGPDANGALNLDVTDPGTTSGDNALSVTLKSTSTISSGYVQGCYVNMDISGTKSGGISTQENAFAADITVSGGTNASLIGGGYIYIAKSGSPTLTSAAIYGFCTDVQQMGACDYLTNLWLQRSASTKGTSVDAMILFSMQGSTPQCNTLLYMQGIAFPTYFLQFASSAANGFLDATARNAATSIANLVVRMGSTTGYIPIMAAT